MDIKKIYFDMDGVLADFDRGVVELCGIDTSAQGDGFDPRLDDLMWEKIKGVDHFYDKLELMPGSKEMFDAVYQKYGNKCEILTGIPKPKRGILTSGEDKTKWVHRLLAKDSVVNIVFREQKPEYCTGRDCVLIDDLEGNIRDWENIGGTGIVNKSAEETMRVLREKGIL